MAANKTVPTQASVQEFLDQVDDVGRQQDSVKLIKLFAKATGKKATMWGPAIIGFGLHHYKYESGREGDQPVVSFSPRKAGISIYGISEALSKLGLEAGDLGKASTSGGCVRVKNLEGIDLPLLAKVAKEAAAILK